LKQAVKLYNSGRLYQDTREELALQLDKLIGTDSVERALLKDFVKKLLCDQELSVRELAAQKLDQTDQVVALQIYEELHNEPDEWTQFCATYSLGFWGNHEAIIRLDIYDKSLPVRRAADFALELYTKRQSLSQLVQLYQEPDGLTRLAAYLALQEIGIEQIIWLLYEKVAETSLAEAFLRELVKNVSDGVKSSREKRQEEEQKFWASRDTIHF
jgi:HEAT repeat protein